MTTLLANIDAKSIILDPHDLITFTSENLNNFNLHKDGRVNNEALQQLVRAVRRSGNIQEVTMELPRGPLGKGITRTSKS